jgi:putative membrane protein
VTADPAILSIQRPDPSLWKLYLVRSILSGPLVFFMLPFLYFRYHTMRYRFDEEGVSMGWGILFRREVNLTYARIQDIHVTSGPLQRWLGLADLHVQTASGSAAAEMVIEGLLEYERVRDFLYERMRGVKDPEQVRGGAETTGEGASGLAAALDGVRAELKAAREALETLARRGGGDA